MKDKRLPGAQIDRWAEAIESRGLSPLLLPVLDALDAFGLLARSALLGAAPLLGARASSIAGRRIDLLLSPDLGTELRRRLGHGSCGHE